MEGLYPCHLHPDRPSALFNLTLVHVQESSYFLLLLNRSICHLKGGLVKLFNQSQNVFPRGDSELQQGHSAVNRDMALRVVT